MRWPAGFFKSIELVEYQYLGHIGSPYFIQNALHLFNLFKVIGVGAVDYME